MLDSLFPHMGELILEKILNKEPKLVINKLGIELSEVVGVHRQLPMIFPDVDLIFDGFSTIDLALELKSGVIFPIEAKLGKTGLARARINEMLVSCSISSHLSEHRVSGKVFAVLNRNYDDKVNNVIGESKLSTIINGHIIPVTDEWGIIARDSIISSWLKLPPDFNGLQTYLSVNEICEQYGEYRFNALVAEILSEVDFYSIWLNKKK